MMTTDDARAAYAPLLEELMPLYDELLRSGVPTVRDGYRKVALIAHGWYMRVEPGVEALLVLNSTGLIEEAAPIRRSMIEHVLALRWLAAEGDRAADTLALGHAYDARKRGDAARLAGWRSVDQAQVDGVVAEIEEAGYAEGNNHLLQFAHRARQYGDEHVLPGYLAETARSHPTYESAASYIEHETQAARPNSRDSVWPVPFATTHLLEALICMQSVYEDEPWSAQLAEALGEYRAITDRVRAQDGLPPVDWTTGRVADG